jgi:chemotaxis protein histidine kinase CheA
LSPRLREAGRNEAWGTLYVEAHTLKSVAGTIGANDLASAASDLERAAYAGEAAGSAQPEATPLAIADALEAMLRHLERVRQTVEAYLADQEGEDRAPDQTSTAPAPLRGAESGNGSPAARAGAEPDPGEAQAEIDSLLRELRAHLDKGSLKARKLVDGLQRVTPVHDPARPALDALAECVQGLAFDDAKTHLAVLEAQRGSDRAGGLS